MAALDDQIRETVSRLLDSLRGRLDSELGSCQDELIQAAREEGARIAAAAADGATAEARREAELQLIAARESAARDVEEQRTRHSAEIEDLQRRLDEAREESQRRFEESEQRIEEIQRRIDDSQKETSTAREETETAREQILALENELETARNDLETARQQLDTTRDDVEATLRDIETSRRDSDAARKEISLLSDTLRAKEERTSQALGLPDAVRSLDEASTFGEVLENLTLRAGREAGRAAVFLVKEGRLRDWRTVGFNLASGAPRLDIELNESGPMAEAVRSGQGVHARGTMQVPEFARTTEEREAAAWPVSVGGSVVAVLYADSPAADKSDKPFWPAFLDVLARHAGRVLEGITVRQAAGLMTGRATGIAPSVSRPSSGSIQ